MLQNGDFLGMGIKFPVSINNVTGRFNMVSDDEDIKEAIYIILMTHKGERLIMPNFGSRINDYVFEVMNETNLTLMANNIKIAIENYEKRISNLNVSIAADEVDEGKMIVNITYTISKTNEAGNVVFPFYLQEGTGGQNV